MADTTRTRTTSEIVDLSALKAARESMRLDEDDLRDTAEHACELAIRLVAPGPKAHAVSASECHEIADAVLHAYDEGNAAGIAATCAAAPVLIEIVELDKRIEQVEAEQAAARTSFIVAVRLGRRADCDAAVAAVLDLKNLKERRRAALARVSLGATKTE